MATRTIVLTADRHDAERYVLEHSLEPGALIGRRRNEDVVVVWPRVIDRLRGLEADRIESTPAALASPAHDAMLATAMLCTHGRT